MSEPTGKLSIVATPIGNREDITLRALRTLREADVIAAEDTRHTGQLLAHYDIRKPLVSYHEFNEARRTPEILERLRAGQRVALVTDAGMPTVSDPGLRLIRAILEVASVGQALVACGAACGRSTSSLSVPDQRATKMVAPPEIEVIPGPSAVTAALAGSGSQADRFLFYGFLPHKSGQRRKALLALAPLPYALVFFESPYRLLRALGDIEEILGNRQMVVARELTKKFEEFIRGDLASVRKRLEPRTIKGEITLIIEAPNQ